MNKAKLKKEIGSNKLLTLLNTSKFVGFFCVQNTSVFERIQLKKRLDRNGFEYQLVKNALLFKRLAKALPFMKGIFSGSLAICYAKQKNTLDFLALKNVFSILKKSKNTFFLGGFFEGMFVNCLFERKIYDLKEKDSIHVEHLSNIQYSLTNLIKTTSIPGHNLSFLLDRFVK